MIRHGTNTHGRRQGRRGRVATRLESGVSPDSVGPKKLRRIYPILLRGGATLPAETDDAYLLKVRAAGGFRQHERNHLNALAATFLPKLPSLPPELVRRVVEYAFHVGDY